MKRYIKSDIDISNIPEEHKQGDCFVQALNTYMNNPVKYTLVHGVITGQGAIEGLHYCHAWVEDGQYVIDNTLPNGLKRLPIDVYYQLAQVQLTKKYDSNQVYDMLTKYETYGPWDKVFEKYP